MEERNNNKDKTENTIVEMKESKWFGIWHISKSESKDKRGFLKWVQGKLFFAYTCKGDRRRLTLPVGFDLMAHIDHFPPLDNGFDSELNFSTSKAYYILDLISSIAAKNSDYVDENGYVRINAAILEQGIRDRKAYITYLTNTRLMERNGRYEVGKESMGYRWAEPYFSSKFQTIEVECSHIDEAEIEANYITGNNEFEYLNHWYQTKLLQIAPLAPYYVAEHRGKRLADESKKSWSRNKQGSLVHPNTQYLAIIRNINALQNADYKAHIDTTVYRLHSVLTYFKSEYRNFITYDGQQLVAIDISNCQPYIACLVLKEEFWKAQSTLSLSSLPPSIIALFTDDLLIMIRNFLDKTDPTLFEPYIEAACSGQMYDQLAKEVSVITGGIISRADAKIMVFYTLFSSNAGQANDPKLNEMKRLFAQFYPEVYKLFKTIKRNFKAIDQEGQHSRLSCLLQSIESYIMLQQVCRRIWKEKRHTVPVFTIHDSIVTTATNVEYVKFVLVDTFSHFIGYAPKVKQEVWSLDNLDQSILSDAKTIYKQTNAD